MALSRKQLSVVHIAKKQLNLAENDYRSLLNRIGQVDSSKDLDQIGFEAVMQYLCALGFESEFAKNFYGHRPGMASPKQVGLIRQLWHEYTGHEGDDATLNRWLDRSFGVSALRFVTAGQAPKAITALKAMKVRRNQRQSVD